MTTSPVHAPPAAAVPVLRIDGLTKRFGTATAVDGLSLDVHPREVFGLLGPNGAGKTTTISMICGELPADGGEVLLEGRPLGRTAEDRSRVGLCPQDIVVWQRLTCLEQLEFVGRLHGTPRQAARERGRWLLGELGLEAKCDALAGSMSGGMQRRLNIALALVHEPELIILDEPGAGLDPASRVLVRGFVRRLARDCAVLVTTHELDEAERMCDRVAVVDHGRLLACDRPEALVAALPYRSLIDVAVPTDDVPPWAAALADAAGLAPSELLVTPGVLTVPCPDAAAILPQVLAALAAVGGSPGEVRVRQAGLEDVFLDLTGRRVD